MLAAAVESSEAELELAAERIDIEVQDSESEAAVHVAAGEQGFVPDMGSLIPETFLACPKS